ncbi:MAG: sodium-translocating pyrophosphatase [Endomicrobiaceae bacterium]|nr:sodium-translocating pyrophosphatase [Endomicrobiaceae bacterium]MDD3052855.1 sodium-translocating pyrophosphatase [Endomicrobiaceae bacterium]MDD5101758.1 sodium-translocating pyrophosphatase [Endomicrobiaceae bacterium]
MLFRLKNVLMSLAVIAFVSVQSFAGEADLVMPDLSSVNFLGGISGSSLLLFGLLVCVFGLAFGFVQFNSIKNLPVHKSMLDVSELIYETCKTYLVTQGKFIIILEALLASIIFIYFYFFSGFALIKVFTIILCSIVGILGSYAVAWFGMRLNTFANSRSAFASLKGKPFPTFAIPLRSGMSIGMLLISIELFIMLIILLFIPRDFAGPCFIGFAIGESLGASVLRIAGGIFTKIADIGSDLMKIVFNIKEDDARNPGVIADCTGDNAGDSVGPTADGFETYGVTGVALITFIMLAISNPENQVKLLVWIFVMRLVMIIASAISYWLNGAIAKSKYENAEKMNFEAPLTSLVWITSIVSVLLTFVSSYAIVGDLANGLWWKLSIIITCGTMAGAIIPEVVKIFTSTKSAFVKNVVNSSKNGGASLNILAGLTSGNFSAYWMGLVIIILMAIAYGISSLGFTEFMSHPAVFSFGLVAFGFLGMGPVTIAVDSYGPVTDNAQSVYELSLIETIPGIKEEIKKDFGFEPNFDKSKLTLEENDGAGNTFKATAKPVLIGTAVVGATTMIFSIIFTLMSVKGEDVVLQGLSLLHAPFLLGLIAGGAVIYWFTGASMHAVTSGAYKAVEFIKANIKLDSGITKASTEDSKKVVEICTKYAQKGMFNLFLVIFFTTIAFAFIEPYFFIGYLISIAIFGLFQAIFMANAGGAWDNAKKVVEVDMREKGTELHKATVVGDTVGDPFKDTSSVALNPIIKFTTLFGLLALELALVLSPVVTTTFAVIFFAISLVYVVKSFTSMVIK